MDVHLHILSVFVCVQCGLALVSVGVSMSLVSRRPRRADPQARCVERSGHAKGRRPQAQRSEEGLTRAMPGMGDLSWGCTEGGERAKMMGIGFQNRPELSRTF